SGANARTRVAARSRPGLDPPEDEQDDDDHDHQAEAAHRAVSVAVAIPSAQAVETAEQSDDQDDEQDCSKRHSSLSVLSRGLSRGAVRADDPAAGVDPVALAVVAEAGFVARDRHADRRALLGIGGRTLLLVAHRLRLDIALLAPAAGIDLAG